MSATYFIGTIKEVEGDIVKAMGEAVAWAQSLGTITSQDNDNDSGEVFLESTDLQEDLIIKVRWARDGVYSLLLEEDEE